MGHEIDLLIIGYALVIERVEQIVHNFIFNVKTRPPHFAFTQIVSFVSFYDTIFIN